MDNSNKELTNQEKMVRGSAWMTISNIISRLMGALYIIPWYAWMGEHGNAANSLFNMGYNIYALFLMISSAGIPSAIAKQTAHYNSLNEYGVSRKLFIKALQVMGILGVVCALIMYIGSPWLASASGGGKDLIPAMRSLSIAVLAFPVMSVIRGYFQGNQNMMPFAVSQIIEQVARIFYMLLATYIIMKVQQGDYVTAVTHSTFAAFIGMIGSMAALLYFMNRQRATMKVYVEHSSNRLKVSPNSLLVQTLKEAVPFIIVGSGITIFKLVDQFTFVKFMGDFTNYSQRQLVELFSIFSANPDKLTMVVIALATSLATVSLPLVTESFTLKDGRELAKLVCNNFQLFAFVMFPSLFGMILLAYPLNTMFYQPDRLGSLVLIEACVVGLFLGLYSLASTILQGLYENGATMAYLGVGFAIKVLLQIPLIRVFEVYGPLIATMIGFGVACYLIVRKIHAITHFSLGLTGRRTLLIFVMTLAMSAVCLIVRQLSYLVLDPASKMQSFLIVLLVALTGVAVYVYLSLKVGIAEKLLGDSMVRLKERLKIK